MITTAPPNFPVILVIDRDIVNGRFIKAIEHEGRPGCEIRYSGNLGDYEYLNGNVRKCFAASVYPETERDEAKKRASE